MLVLVDNVLSVCQLHCTTGRQLCSVSQPVSHKASCSTSLCASKQYPQASSLYFMSCPSWVLRSMDAVINVGTGAGVAPEQRKYDVFWSLGLKSFCNIVRFFFLFHSSCVVTRASYLLGLACPPGRYKSQTFCGNPKRRSRRLDTRRTESEEPITRTGKGRKHTRCTENAHRKALCSTFRRGSLELDKPNQPNKAKAGGPGRAWPGLEAPRALT